MRKAIKGYEGFYEIDEDGSVYSLERTVNGGRWRKQRVPSRKLKWIAHPNGYLVIRLAKNGVTKQYRVHILVAQTFIENPLGLPEVNHKDLDKHNPHKNNLEWCTPLQNMAHARENGTTAKGFRNSGAKLTACQIMIAHDLALRGHLFASIGKRLNVNRNTIPKAISRIYGYDWRSQLPNLKKRASEVRWKKALPGEAIAPLPERYCDGGSP